MNYVTLCYRMPAAALLMCYTVCVELITTTLRPLNLTNMSISIANRFSLLIAEFDEVFRKEEELIKEHIARCKELVEELDSLECAD